MIGRLNHVAIAVPDLAAAADAVPPAARRRGLGAGSAARAWRDDGVRRPCPTPRSSCWRRSARIRRSPPSWRATRAAAIHHLCYEVADILAARDHLLRQGARVLGDGEPKIGAHDKPVLFLHPKDFSGTLVEIEQA